MGNTMRAAAKQQVQAKQAKQAKQASAPVAPTAPVAVASAPVAPTAPVAVASAPVGTVAPSAPKQAKARGKASANPTHVVAGPRPYRNTGGAGGANAWACVASVLAANPTAAPVASMLANGSAAKASGTPCNALGSSVAYWLGTGALAVAPCCLPGGSCNPAK